MSPALNGRSALECFKCGNVIKINNRKFFDFYLGLPHITVLKKNLVRDDFLFESAAVDFVVTFQ